MSLTTKDVLEDPRLFIKIDPERYKEFIKIHTNDFAIISFKGTIIPQLYCEKCKSTQSFTKINENYQNGGDEITYTHSHKTNKPKFQNYDIVTKTRTYNIEFRCTTCETERYTYNFIININELDEIIITKTGTYPPLRTRTDQQVTKTISRYNLFWAYNQGRKCEILGYGLGACAYYRRIIEEIIDKMLKELAEFTGPEDHQAWLSTQSEKPRMGEKIERLGEYVHGRIRPDNHNSINLLYKRLSENIHAMDDETCLKDAERLRTILDITLKRIAELRAEDRLFKDLLDGENKTSKPSQ